MKYIIMMLLIPSFSYGRDNVDMALTVAPYVLAADDDKPFRTAGKVFASHLTTTLLYVVNQSVLDPWAVTSATNAALICNLQEEIYCAAAVLTAGHLTYKYYQNGTKTFWGLTIGVASGSLVPGIVANF